MEKVIFNMITRVIQTIIIAALTQVTSCFVSTAVVMSQRGLLARTQAPLGLRAVNFTPRSSYRSLSMKVELEPEETVKKYGLEAGLFQVFKDGQKEGVEGRADAATTAKDLLKRYGSAYLITSITFALISFSICYLAVSNGVDISALLSKIGIEATTPAETTGTVAVAYAIHKAASPIRFPPTVALTPVVAKLIGKDEAEPTE